MKTKGSPSAKGAALDVRDSLLPRGGSGNATIEEAKEYGPDVGNGTRTWKFTFENDGKTYVAFPCVLQTEDWKPEPGDRVRFDRQPEGTNDTFLYTTLLTLGSPSIPSPV